MVSCYLHLKPAFLRDAFLKLLIRKPQDIPHQQVLTCLAHAAPERVIIECAEYDVA